jgi:hypothetical protein
VWSWISRGCQGRSWRRDGTTRARASRSRSGASSGRRAPASRRRSAGRTGCWCWMMSRAASRRPGPAQRSDARPLRPHRRLRLHAEPLRRMQPLLCGRLRARPGGGGVRARLESSPPFRPRSWACWNAFAPSCIAGWAGVYYARWVQWHRLYLPSTSRYATVPRAISGGLFGHVA